ncbi:major facilitator superfamily domain-containing protein [Obelidium mucronatum]|nr:major facilitator superfamily domain-containing protein [Obelidium mucronatum]
MTRYSESTPLLPRPVTQTIARQTTPLPSKQLLVLCMIHICEPIQHALLHPFIYFMIKDFGVVENQIGWYVGLITSLFSLAQVISSIPIGWLSDRYGRRPLLFLGLAGNCVCYIMLGLSTSLPTAILSRFLLGLVNGNIGVAKSMTGEITDKTNRPKAFALLGIFSSFGSIIGPLIGGVLSNPVDQLPCFFGDSELLRVYPYLLPCLFSAFVSFLALIVGWVWLEETLHGATPTQEHIVDDESVESEETIGELVIEDTAATPSTERHLLVGPKTDDDGLFPNRAYPAVVGMGLLALTSIMSDEMYTLLSALPKGQLQSGFGFNAFDIGVSLSAQGVFTFIAQIQLFPIIHSHLSSLRTLRLGLIAFICSFIIFPLLTYPGPTIFWPGLLSTLALATSGKVLSFTSMYLVVTESADSRSQLGQVNGMGQMAACLARTVGPLVGGAMWGWMLGLGVFWGKHLVYGVVAVVGVVLYVETFWIQQVFGDHAFLF